MDLDKDLKRVIALSNVYVNEALNRQRLVRNGPGKGLSRYAAMDAARTREKNAKHELRVHVESMQAQRNALAENLRLVYEK